MNIFRSFNLTAYTKQSYFSLYVIGVFLLFSANNNLIAQPTLSAPTATAITNTTTTLGGTVDTGTGITERGTVWNVGSAPTILDNPLPEGGTSTGTFTHARIGLTPKSQIFYAPYAIDGGGTTIGPDASFYTLANEPGAIASFSSGAQTSTSIDLTWGTSTGATGYLVYISAGSTAPTPTLTDGTAPTGSPVIDQAGTSYTETGLTRYTEYSFTVIPYDWDGGEATTYNYGTPITLTSVFTLETAPVVTSPTETAITNNSATLGGNITDVGGNVLTERGTLWETSSPVTISDNQLPEGGTTGGVFTDARSSLPAKTQIYYAPYAINAVATTIGPEGSFYTLGNNPGAIATFTSPAQAETTIDLSWGTSANAFGYLIYMNTGSAAPSPSLTDGAVPTGSPVANVTGGTTTTISSLSAVTEYSFTIVPYDWDGSEPTTYNYGNSNTLTSVFTLCDYPTTQPTGLSFSTVHGTHFDLNWTGGNGDRTLVVVKEGSAVDAVPVDGVTYSADTDFGSGTEIGSGNFVVSTADNGSGVEIDDLNSSTTYFVALFSYNNSTKCYNLTAPPTNSTTTAGPLPTSTITGGTGAASISSIQNSFLGAPIVFTFTLTDDAGDFNNTEFSQLTINRETGSDDTGGWTNVLASARLSHNGSESDTYTATPTDNSIVFTGISTSNNRLGNIPEGDSKIVYLEVYLETNLGALQTSIDGLNLAFEIADTDFTIAGGGSSFLLGTTTNSGNNNEITVVATEIAYTTQPSATATATIALAQQPILEATDDNGNIDLDFSETLTVTTPDATLNPASALASFTNGYADFTGSGFNLQSTGSSRIRVTSSGLVANSSPNTVVSASTTVTELTAGIATSPLSSGSTNNALLGFNLTTTGSTLNFTGGTFTTSSEPDGKILNLQLYRSTDGDYSTAGDNTLIAGAAITTPTAGTISIAGITESIDGSTVNNFFIVAEVEGNVFSSTPTLQLSIANTSDLSVSTGAVIGTPFVGDVFSFVDVSPPTILSTTASVNPIYDGSLIQTIQVIYSESMQTGVSPSISFANSTDFTPGAGSWSTTNTTNDTWTQTFTHGVVAEEFTESVTIGAGILDLAGNADAGGGTSNTFVLDTRNPTATVAISTSPITLANPVQTVTITYDEAMDPSVAQEPTINFATSADFTTNNDGIWTVGNTVWTESFTHGVVQEQIAAETAIVPTASGATDVAGNTDIGDSSPTFSIDTKQPEITSITTATISGIYTTSTIINIEVNMDEAVTVTGTPQITLNTTSSAAVVNYNPGLSTTTQLVFSYTIAANENADPLDVVSMNLNGGSILDAVSNNANLTIPLAPNRLQDDKTIEVDTQQPSITAVTSSTASGYYNDVNVISIQITFDEIVAFTGTPVLSLNSGGTATYTPNVAGLTHNFTYTVGATDNANPLDYVATNSLVLNGGTIRDVVSLDAVLTLPAINGGNSIQNDKTIIIDTDEPIALTLTPADDSFNYPVAGNLIIQFDENIQIINNGFITVFNVTLGVPAFSYDMSIPPAEVTFNGTDQITINPAIDLDGSSQYYVRIDNTIVLDLASNQFAGYTTTTDWNFVTFGPPIITSIAPETGTAVCIGSNVVITGSFLTGTTQVTFEGGLVATGSDVVVISDTEVRASAPLNSLSGIINVRKDGVSSGNPDVNINSTGTILVGPSSATISAGISAISPVCSSGSITQSTIAITILGGTSNYTFNYNRANDAGSINDVFIENNYASVGDGVTIGADITITPLHLNQDNDYTLVSVTDNEGCSAPILNGTYTVVVNERRTVDAGSDVLGLGEVSYFVGDVLDLPVIINTGDIDFPLTNPPSTSSSDIIWSNPISSDGSFDNTLLLNPTYTIGLNDIFNNSINLTLTTTDNLPNCDAVTDVLTINLITAATATPEIIGGGNVFCWDGTANPVVTLNGSVGGGAATGIWERIPDPLDPDDGTYQGFDTGSTPATTSTTLVGSTYRFTAYETNTLGYANLTLTPTDGIGGTAEPITITLNVISSINFINLEPSVCEQSIGTYSITGTAGSTYTWTISNGTLLTTNEVDSTTIRVRWNQGIGGNIVDVFETRPDGCPSAVIIENVIVNPLPTVGLDPNIATSYDISSNRKLLESNQPILTSLDKLNHFYSGNGVVKDSNDSLYYFFPNLASLGTNDVSYSFTDPIGCTNTTPSGSAGIQFTVVDVQDPIFDLSQAPNTPLADDLCEDAPPRRIKLDPNVNLEFASDFKFFRFFGKGITAPSQVDQEATYNPSTASAGIEGEERIFILMININDDLATIDTFSSKPVNLHLLPTLAPDPIDNTICDGDLPFELTRDATANPGVAEIDFRFALAGDSDPSDDTDPSNFIQRIGNEYFVNPANAGFDPINYSVDSISFNISYSFTNGFGCINTITRRVDVYQTPPPPSFSFTNVCVIDLANIPASTVLNVASGVNFDTGDTEEAEIFWFNNEFGTGTPLFRGDSFTPDATLLVLDTTSFYAFQESLNCTSPFSQVTYEKFTNISIAPVSNCSNGTNIEIDVTGSIGSISRVFWTIEDSNGTILLNQEERDRNPTTSGYYNFTEMTTPDNYTLTATIESDAGCNSNIITEVVILESIPVTESSIYTENFEADNGNWISENRSNGAIWEYGLPNGNLINTAVEGQNVWMTSLNPGYSAGTETNLYSACFDISALERPMIKIGTYYNTTGDDGAVIEYTNDTNLATATWEILGALGTGDKWYNAQNIAASPGDQQTVDFGWSANTDSAWQESKHVLDDVNPAMGNVILRVQFVSGDANRPNHDGLAIDNVFIGNRTRTVLLENFSSTIQPINTADENASIDTLVNNTTALAVIEYHPDIDGDDPLSSSPDADARALYYGITTTPRVAIDGKAEADLRYTEWGQKEYSIRALNSAPLTIITTVVQNGNAIDISSNITALENVPGNFIVHTAIVANQLLASNYPAEQMLSGENRFNYVVQKMLPSASGQKFETPLTQGDNMTVTNTWSTSEQYAPGTYSIIIFVQDEQSKLVYQTEILEPTINTVTGIEEQLDLYGFASYPNPANEQLTVQFKNEVIKDTRVNVYNQLGQLTYTTLLSKGNSQVELATVSWTPGIYYIQTELNGVPIRKRIMVQH